MFIHWHSPLFVWPLACFLPLPSLYTQVFGQKPRTYADFWPKVTYTRRFYTKILFSMRVFGQKSRIWAFPCGFWPKVAYMCLPMWVLGLKLRTYAAVLYTVVYILPFGEFDVGRSCWVGCECGWVFLGSDVVCWMLLLWPETAFSLIFLWK